MSKPLVAVVGRSNVGKSTFFNRICGRRISIVKDTPGVTRDRIYADAEWCGKHFTLVDTGGIETDDIDFLTEIRRQAEVAIDLADVIVFMVDGKAGLLASDREVASLLRSAKKPVVLAVNKLDNNETDNLYDFYELALGEPFPISCEQALGLGDLLDEIVRDLPDGDEDGDVGLKIAFVGKPNVGKSSLVNRLLGFERVIVSDVAGTTRDIVEETVLVGGVPLRLADTAGLRDTDDAVERIGVERARKRIQSAQLVLAVFDYTRRLGEEDCRLAHACKNVPAIAVVNKSDLATKIDYMYIHKYFKHVVVISAKSGDGLEELSQAIGKVLRTAEIDPNEGMLFTERQRNAARRAKESVQEADRALRIGMTLDAVTVSLEGAVAALLELTGERVTEAVVDEVFSHFCVGK